MPKGRPNVRDDSIGREAQMLHFARLVLCAALSTFWIASSTGAQPAKKKALVSDSPRAAIIGDVIHIQTPPPGTSDGPRVSTIPNVVGKMVRDAIDMLRFTELQIVQRELTTERAAAGTVMKQRPEAGTPVSRAKAETLFIAAAPREPRPHRPSIWEAIAGAIISSIPPPSRPSDAPLTPSTDTTAKVPLRDGDSAIVPGEMIQDRTTVPDLNGRTPQMVAALLRKSRLRAGETSRDYSDEVPEGRVFRQHPPAKTEVVTGTSVMTWYSAGPHPSNPTTIIPSVIGLSLRDAEDSLRRVGFLRGHVDYVTTPGAKSLVLHQSPHEGESAHRGDVVDLTIADPPVQVEVPQVIGLTRSQAARRLKDAGLGVGRVTLVVLSRDTGIVSQKPGAKALVDSGSLVDLVENRPPEIRRVSVPDLSGKSLADAATVLRASNLLLGEVVRRGTVLADSVTDQHPAAAEQVPMNSEVNVALGRETSGPTAVVPAVVNLTVDSARRLLTNAGFTQLSISGGGDRLTSASIVESQVPVAGTVAAPNVMVSLVAKIIPPLTVPNFVGRTKAEARGEAEFDNLRIVITSEVRRLRLDDRIVSQNPRPRSPRRPDNTIDVDVEIPVMPPLLAGMLGFAVAGGAVAWFVRRPPPPAPPPPAVTLVPVTREAAPPVLSDDGAESLVRSEFTLQFDVAWDPATIEAPEDDSIAKPEVWRHV
jgi:beta-lactam-binding protein with PASTA domain